MVSHAFFLRSQGAEYHQAAHALVRGDIDGAGLEAEERALLTYAEKLTREPAAINDADIDRLRDHDFTDEQVWEATFIASLYNLFTRMADAFAIMPPQEMEEALGLAE